VRLSQRDLLILVIVCVTIAAVAMVLAVRPAVRSRVGSGAPPQAGTAYVGSWRVLQRQDNAWYELDIARAGSRFIVTVPAVGQSVPYKLAGGKLVPAVKGDVDFSLQYGHLVMTEQSQVAGQPGPSETLQPLAVSQATADPQARQNDQVEQGVHVIQVAVQSWAVDHQDTYPPVDVVVPGGSFARYAQSWPTDPWTDQPMTPGKGQGHYEYTVQGDSFSITGYGANGMPVLTVP